MTELKNGRSFLGTNRPGLSTDLNQIEQYGRDLKQAEEHQRDLWYEDLNVPSGFLHKSFADFKRELQPKAFDAVKAYKAGSLVLFSPGVYGVGKTHLVCALASHLVATKVPAEFRSGSYGIVRHYCPVLFTTELELLSRIRQTYNRKRGDDEGETEEDVFQHLDKFDLLIIDDVGKTRPRDYSFLQSVYFRIVDARYVQQEWQALIITTNLTLQELEEHIGGASADRLREMCGETGFIPLKGHSYRRK